MESKEREELQAIRTRAKELLDSLVDAVNEGDDIIKKENEASYYYSWIQGNIPLSSIHSYDNTDGTDESTYPNKNCQFFDLHGFLKVDCFSLPNQTQAMKDEMKELVETKWHPNNPSNSTTVFRTDEKQIEEQGSDDYFLSSANKVHFFAESGAMTTISEKQEGETKNNIELTTPKLKSEYINNKIAALNKAGHALHLLPNSSFNTYTSSPKLLNLLHSLGWKDPVVPQSMYIFKQKKVGSAVTSHQDSTFLYTTPKQSCVGLWLALDDSTIENGCLWVRPGSHRESVRRKFARNPLHFSEESIQQRSNIAKGDTTQSQMIFIDETPSTASSLSTITQDQLPPKSIPWEGKIPGDDGKIPTSSQAIDNLFQSGFIPIECKAGDVLIFPGTLDHLSLPNYSNDDRHTFQLHLIEGEMGGADGTVGGGVKWSETNWLQYPSGVEFMSLGGS